MNNINTQMIRRRCFAMSIIAILLSSNRNGNSLLDRKSMNCWINEFQNVWLGCTVAEASCSDVQCCRQTDRRHAPRSYVDGNFDSFSFSYVIGTNETILGTSITTNSCRSNWCCESSKKYETNNTQFLKSIFNNIKIQVLDGVDCLAITAPVAIGIVMFVWKYHQFVR